MYELERLQSRSYIRICAVVGDCHPSNHEIRMYFMGQTVMDVKDVPGASICSTLFCFQPPGDETLQCGRFPILSPMALTDGEDSCRIVLIEGGGTFPDSQYHGINLWLGKL